MSGVETTTRFQPVFSILGILRVSFFSLFLAFHPIFADGRFRPPPPFCPSRSGLRCRQAGLSLSARKPALPAWFGARRRFRIAGAHAGGCALRLIARIARGRAGPIGFLVRSMESKPMLSFDV